MDPYSQGNPFTSFIIYKVDIGVAGSIYFKVMHRAHTCIEALASISIP